MNAESDINIKLIAERIIDLQEISGKSDEAIADLTGISLSDYKEYKGGAKDFAYTFLFKLSRVFGVDVVELMTGNAPKLSGYSITRNGEGLPITRREGFTYQTLAYTFKGRSFNPLIVFAPYDKSAVENLEKSEMSKHEGHEFNLIISGSLKIIIHGRVEILNAGDSIYYAAEQAHNMAAVSEDGCKFLSVLSDM